MSKEIAPPASDELIVVVGPTATGKTALAVQLCERWDGEIVSADSVQVYRGFDVGSGKPSVAERGRAPHHLVDIVDPLDAMDAGRFVALADDAIAGIRARGRVPIVCGGTYLWVKALVEGLVEAAPADEAARARHRAIVDAGGRPALHAKLAEIDPPSAARLSPNDFVRVSRALEVYELTGKPQSTWHAEHGFRTRRHPARLVGVARAPKDLDTRIEARAHAWLSAGWIEEVEALLAGGFGDARAMGSVGYRQIRDHLQGTIRRDELLAMIVRATRVFVRRQRTWLRDAPVSWIQAPYGAIARVALISAWCASSAWNSTCGPESRPTTRSSSGSGDRRSLDGPGIPRVRSPE